MMRCVEVGGKKSDPATMMRGSCQKCLDHPVDAPTITHLNVHSTGHGSRLNRNFDLACGSHSANRPTLSVETKLIIKFGNRESEACAS